MEHSRGLAGNNIVTVHMLDKGLSLQAAVDQAGEDYAELVRIYWEARTAVEKQSFGDAKLNADIHKFVTEMSNWPVGNIAWSFESKRYFGDMVDLVKKTRRATVN